MFTRSIVEKLDIGSHMMFIGEVTESRKLPSGTSCTYAHDHKSIKEILR